jgi:hypothetical protein
LDQRESIPARAPALPRSTSHPQASPGASPAARLTNARSSPLSPPAGQAHRRDEPWEAARPSSPGQADYKLLIDAYARRLSIRCQNTISRKSRLTTATAILIGAILAIQSATGFGASNQRDDQDDDEQRTDQREAEIQMAGLDQA